MSDAKVQGVQFRKDGHLIRLLGAIDEFADYSPLLQHGPPLRLALGGVRTMNSQGIRKWMKFIKDYGTQPLELHECPPVFIDAANMIPDVISSNGDKSRVKSVIVPYNCATCRKDYLQLIPIERLTVNGDDVTLPEVSCPQCGGPLATSVDESDHFLFLTSD